MMQMERNHLTKEANAPRLPIGGRGCGRFSTGVFGFSPKRQIR